MERLHQVSGIDSFFFFGFRVGRWMMYLHAGVHDAHVPQLDAHPRSDAHHSGLHAEPEDDDGSPYAVQGLSSAMLKFCGT